MHEAVRNLLLLAIAGCLVTVAGSGAAWWLDEERRLRRFLRRALGDAPEAVIISPGRGRAAGLSTANGVVAVLWDGGVRGLVYRLRQLVGAEMIVDDLVVGRAHRGEPRRALDQAPGAAHRVALRLIFDNPRDPDFELELWPPADPHKRERETVTQAIAASRRWLSGVEAILRQTDPAPAPPRSPAAPTRSPDPPAQHAPEPEHEADEDPGPPWDEEDEEP